jgi:3-oxoadipate enol-lactonase
MPTAVRAGVRIHYTDSREGSPVLLLHGLGADSTAWRPLLPMLAGHRLIRPDHRGSGRSELGESRLGIADLAEDAVAVLDAAGVASAHVVGYSLGGMVAQELILRHPQRVRSLTLVSTTPRPATVPPHPALFWHLVRAMRTRGAVRRRHLDLAFHGPASVVDAPERLALEAGEKDLPQGPGPLRQLRAALRWSAVWRLHSVVAPTLVLHGTHDRLFPAANASLLARLIPGAQLAMLPRAGHAFITDARDVAGPLMARFLGEVDSGRQSRRGTVPGRVAVPALAA